MATCSLAELQAAACENGFTCLDDVSSRAVELQLWYQLAGSSADLKSLLEKACSNGFLCANEVNQRGVELQMLCDIYTEASVTPSPPECDNLIPDGAVYNEFGGYGYFGAQAGSIYSVVFGANDVRVTNADGNPPFIDNDGSGDTFNLLTSEITPLISFVGGTPGEPVTAQLCLVPVNQYNIDASAGAGGSISPDGTTTVDAGDDLILTATPEPGYSVSQWFLDGNPVDGTDSSYTITGINSDHTISVEFVMVPLIPAMTDYTVPSGEASASAEAEFEPDYAWKAFSQVPGYYWKADAPVPQWLQYQFPAPVVATAYSLILGQFPTNWTISGSNNGIDWTVLDTRVGQGAGTIQYFFFSNSTAYSYYRYTQTTLFAMVYSWQLY